MNFDWLHKGTRLQDHLQNDHQNNFTLIRLIAALIVVKEHSFSGTTPSAAGSVMNVLHINAFGLPSFFFISGLLVSQSLEFSSSWRNFLWKRFLRLYPAACLSIVFCAFILGPIVTTWSMKDYFSSHLFYQFLSTCFLIQVKYQLPGVFENSLLGHSSVNSSLWTICLELKLYLGLLFFWLLKIPGKKYLLFLLILVLLIAGQVFPDKTDLVIYNLIGKHINIFGEFTCTMVFLTGVLTNMYKQKIFIRNYWLIPILILDIFFVKFHDLGMLAFILIPAINIFVATKGLRLLKKITPRADLSYGIYVFAFPFQQVVANYLFPTNTWTFFLLTVLIVLPFALFSWYLVEKKALGLKGLVT
ncbi:MAG TPA: acyltransferase [Puia sp.]|nr:acyltransferase [Puia sp.]